MPDPAYVDQPLLERLAMLSPEVLTAVSAHLRNIPEESRLSTFDGTDASSELIILLVEALLRFQKIKLETEDRTLNPTWAVSRSRQYVVLGQLLEMEPLLIQSARSAIELHEKLWGKSVFGTAT